jgi:hypothetical protein
MERRAALVVEGAQPLEGPYAGGLEGNVGADDLLDGRPFAHGGYVFSVDRARHRPTLEAGCG